MGQRRGTRAALVTAGAVALVVIVYGGYGRRWGWVGINGRTATLWDWLHLLLLPLAAVLLPLWLRHRPRMGPPLRAALSVAVAGFAVVVMAGYAVPWPWTGFVGNSLWDWLNLGALPLAITLIPVLVELRAEWGRRHAAALAAGVASFVTLVVAGYAVPWPWTGFTGNTVWDWLHLLLLPLLVPTVAVPALRPAALARMAPEERPEPSPEPAEEPVAPVSE